AAGGKPANIVKLNTYLTDVRYRADLIPIREAIFGKQLPASTLVGVTALAHPDWMIEVEAIAVI
ncbi:MAG: RidA family protein, partial [candidate division NC10 bacterium]